MDREEKARFAEIVISLRSGRNVRSFAKIVGVSHPTILKWERGEGEPRRENLERIAELRGETLDTLLAFLSGQQSSPQERVFLAIQGASKEQLAGFLEAIGHRLKNL
ncbi:helix-turn-helix domain-containing protein [Planktothrix paucivesiculata]|uniref:Helix-turn-helix domain-containing protein n=1 Tax=Planktothrix paucivesiculata PCC 9631 TaxID=671071 RepID=A0A7Z9DZ67_9CYAN|nr:helix-turn-helix domain-containing protein [Planktothrix paucivesiculata]VXD17179.1 Helix-turn-helix domain-containing protein [Planktothrix paucivesiculata PCC 9631]